MNSFSERSAKNEFEYARLGDKLILIIRKQINRQYFVDVSKNIPQILNIAELLIDYKLQKGRINKF